jgi:hypothetical protein
MEEADEEHAVLAICLDPSELTGARIHRASDVPLLIPPRRHHELLPRCVRIVAA